MGSSRVIVGGKKAEKEPPRFDNDAGWRAIFVMACLLVAAGTVDVALAFYPPGFGTEGWLFRILTAVVGGMPLLSLGLVGGLLASWGGNRPAGTRVFGVLNLIAVVGIAVMLAAYATQTGAVLKATPQDALPLLHKMVLRTWVQGGIFMILHVVACVAAFRSWDGPNR